MPDKNQIINKINSPTKAEKSENMLYFLQRNKIAANIKRKNITEIKDIDFF